MKRKLKVSTTGTRSKWPSKTPIPVKPTQKELVAEPKREDLHKLVDAIDAKIEAAKNKKNLKITEIINRDKSTKTEFSE